MNISAINIKNQVTYKANPKTAKPYNPSSTEQNNVKKGYKKTALIVAGLGLLAIGVCMRKNIGKALNDMFKSTENKTEKFQSVENTIDKGLEPIIKADKEPEKIEEIIPEVLDFDTVYERRINRRKQQRQPKTIVIDEKGNIIDNPRKTTQDRAEKPFEQRFKRERNNQSDRVNPMDPNYFEYNSVDAVSDFIILDEILNGGITRSGKTIEDIASGIGKTDTGLFDGISEKLSDIGESIGKFFDEIGDTIGDFGEGLGDGLGETLGDMF